MLIVSREEVEAYLKNVGKRGMNTLSTLGKLKPFADFMVTDLGISLLGDLANRYDELLDKVASLTATDEEKMECKVTKTFLQTVATRLGQYNKSVEAIKKPR